MNVPPLETGYLEEATKRKAISEGVPDDNSNALIEFLFGLLSNPKQLASLYALTADMADELHHDLEQALAYCDLALRLDPENPEILELCAGLEQKAEHPSEPTA